MLICLVECYCLTLPHCWHDLGRIESEKHSWRRHKQILLKHIIYLVAHLTSILNFYSTYLEYLKVAVFRYMFWVTLVIVAIAGTTRISLFCMGYLIGVFFFLWFGMDLLIKPLRNLLRLWVFLHEKRRFILIWPKKSEHERYCTLRKKSSCLIIMNIFYG